MTGSWRGSDRRQRLPKDWEQRRLLVLERDEHQCTWMDNGRRCPEPAVDVDHIVAGDDHSLDNLRCLCRRHHLTKSSAEGTAARWRHKRRREPPPHPGLFQKPPQ